MYTVFARPQAAACSSAFGHLLPMKEHTEPDRTHTAGPRGVTVQPPSDSYFHIPSLRMLGPEAGGEGIGGQWR